ncbi:hypothetical protein HDZ31DRAFT_81278 [Schizophyllum fasciatum]
MARDAELPEFAFIPPSSHPCPGFLVEWTAGVFEETYPFHRHSPNAKRPLRFALTSLSPPRAHSLRCDRVVYASAATPCLYCRDIKADVEVLEHQAKQPFTKVTANNQLTYTQQAAKLDKLYKQLNKAKLNEKNARRDCRHARARAAQYKQHAVPGMHRLFALARKEGWSAKKILANLRRALQGLYHPRRYSDTDIHLGILLYALGGASALHACNHSYLSLPSLNTIQKYRRQYDLTLATDGVKLLELIDNINVAHGPRFGVPPAEGVGEQIDGLYGWTLSLDEMALAEHVEYIPSKDHIGGLCLEHLGCLGTICVGEDTGVVELAADAVREGRVHVASEATVASISRLSREGYSARPVFIGGTCKQRTWQESVILILYILEAWRRAEHGEKKNGPIFNIASDGDAIRRAALFVICMSEEIKDGHPLWHNLHELFILGLNSRIGRRDVTMDFDYKHLIKRLCTLLCSSEGMLIDNEPINKNILHLFLERIPDRHWPDTSILSLLEPDDAQDVPRALKLLILVTDIRTIDTVDLDPSQLRQFRALCLLGEMIEAFVLPFVDSDMNVPQCVLSIVKFAFLCTGLYVQNSRSFCSHQLFGDLMAMVKAAVLYVEKVRCLCKPKPERATAASKGEVYFNLMGDDVLEAFFGWMRMLGGHSPNASLSELKQRAQAAMNIAAIYEAHPEWERTPRRLRMVNARDLDHLRPRNWKKEAVMVDSCDVAACWKAGVRAAEETLALYGVKMPMSFSERFARPSTDLLRPFGGKYVAISAGVDRSLQELHTPEQPGDDLLAATTILDIDFDRIVEQETAERAARALSEHSHYARIGDDRETRVHKQTIINTYFSSASNRKSHDRLQRVRGYKIGGKAWVASVKKASENLSDHRQFKLGDLFATLISPDGVHLALAVGKSNVIRFTHASTSRSDDLPHAPASEVCLESSPYTICGQILALQPLDGSGATWGWNGDIVRFASSKRQAQETTQSDLPAQAREVMCSVSGSLVRPLAGRQMEVQDLPEGFLSDESKLEVTWLLDESELHAAWTHLGQVAIKAPALQVKIPVFYMARGGFPYLNPPSAACAQGYSWSCPASSTAIVLKSDKRVCMICGRSGIKETDLQTHVGAHLLKARSQIPDNTAKRQISASYPCGFCGGDSCSVSIRGGGNGTVNSSCPQAYGFRISTAKECGPNRPCTNVPIVCPLQCGETHWKYNLQTHFEQRHPSWAAMIQDEVKTRVRITALEQTALGIPSSHVRVWPPTNIPTL